jgi:hypothetical protein
MDMKPKRTRGAQPGNTNALKHGAFSKSLPIHIDDEMLKKVGLSEEIAMSRTIFRRVQSIAENESDPEKLTYQLNTLAATLIRLGSAIRTEQILFGKKGEEDILDKLQLALQECINDGLIPNNLKST